MKNILKITIILASVFVILNGCVKEDFDTTPEYVTEWDANTTIADLKALHNGSPVSIDTALIIKGVVISNDENGNFYKELFIQDETGGIGIELDDGYLYEKYPVGRMVYIKCEGLHLGLDYDVLKLGLGSNIDRINNALIEDYLDISAGGTLKPVIVTLNNLTDTLIGSFVQIENVEFQTTDTIYVNDGEYYAERKIVDCNGNSIILSTSQYVNFGDTLLPQGNGSISAVLSKFSGDYQLRINSPSDVNFTGDNCSK